MALAGIEAIGDDRRDLAFCKLGVALLRALGVKAEIDPNVFLPIEIPKRVMTDEDMLATLLGISGRHNQRWQPSQSEP